MRKILMTAALLAFLAVPGVANAQTSTTDYSGGTSTTAGSATSGTVNHGTIGSGQSFIAESCQFSDGVALQLNGNSAGSDTVESDGCTRQTVTVLSSGTALGGARLATAGLQLAATAPSVSIDGRTYAAKNGTNTLSVFGIGTNGGNRTVTHTFVIGSAAAGSGSGLPRTGAMILRWSLAALALIAVGGLLVLADRRRRPAAVKSPTTRI